MVIELIQKNPDKKFKEFATAKMDDTDFQEKRKMVWEITIPNMNEDPEKEEEKLAKGLIISLKQLYELEQRKN
jgi:hypothetical protein